MMRNTSVWPGDVMKLKDLTLLCSLNSKRNVIYFLFKSLTVDPRGEWWGGGGGGEGARMGGKDVRVTE